jgi:hypothetical protein
MNCGMVLILRPPFPLWRFAVKRSLLIIGAIVFVVCFETWIGPYSVLSWRTWVYWEPHHWRAFDGIGGVGHVGDRWACGLGDTHAKLWLAVQHRRWAEITGRADASSR